MWNVAFANVTQPSGLSSGSSEAADAETMYELCDTYDLYVASHRSRSFDAAGCLVIRRPPDTARCSLRFTSSMIAPCRAEKHSSGPTSLSAVPRIISHW